MPTVRELLSKLELGSSVAEYDEALEDYFIETEAFHSLINEKIDIIAGDKGTGKTAIYRILKNRYTRIEQLKNVEVLPAFNSKGNSIFQKLGGQNKQTESEYNRLWKAYILSLVGNWLLAIWEDSYTPSMKELDRLLRNLDLRSRDSTPKNIFKSIIGRIGQFFRLKSAEVEYTMSSDGSQTIKPKIEFSNDNVQNTHNKTEIAVEDALEILNKSLIEADLTVWVAFDRLDEAFQAYPEVEIPALRALLRAYLDLLEFPNIKIKLFVRRDLFRKVTQGGFVNLTHVIARKYEIIWDDEDLLNLLSRRIKKNLDFCKATNTLEDKNDKLFYRIFPEQVDVGKRKPRTWVWITRRIRDGNNIKPPRNLIDLISHAKNAQIRVEDREVRNYSVEQSIIQGDALRNALKQLSEQRVYDTLIAEDQFLAPYIKKFEGSKVDHNEESISKLLELEGDNLRDVLKKLLDIGFLEVIKGTYKIPALYRAGLSITLGKAFDDASEDDD